ncbi:tyrosine-type recombinase/integrase [Novosphingobium sp. FSY-8]|uniref:Tyrosine-type recombinase/integrase n=1 Tax=Novosphingobium ovatum TaxID=1908523 RepID=A0ABW9XFX1_9SPHN|nr:tyrosine-type recombinase/integrase [Novosphingobium ovatum]NBC37322.1 tyrosine-type recombinase/integrase [Novosphingobium ovatum]
MATPRKLPHVKFVRRKFGGKVHVYAYFNTGQTVSGKPVYARLPDPSAPEFYASYAAYLAGRTKRAKAGPTVSSLIGEYLSSADLAGKATATQNLYRIQLAKAEKAFGDFPVDDLHPHDVQRVIDSEGWGGGTINAFTAAISTMYRWAKKRGKATVTPTDGIDKAKMGQHEPWPDDMLEAGLKADDATIRLAVRLLYYTGQRIGDVCKMRWGQVRAGEVSFVQQKTKIELVFPLHSELATELDQTPKRGIYILLTESGAPMQPARLRDLIDAFTTGLGRKCVPHGLRKNAVNALLESGCTLHEVSSITGQSIQMVEHYAARVNRRKLGTAAMLKFDTGGKKSAS